MRLRICKRRVFLSSPTLTFLHSCHGNDLLNCLPKYLLVSQLSDSLPSSIVA